MKALKEHFESLGIVPDMVSLDTHVPEVESKIKQTKSVLRSNLVLPYFLPLSLLLYAVFYGVSRVNLVPSSTSYDFISPREKFDGRPIDAIKDLGVLFGESAEVFQTTTNDMTPRSRPAIALNPVGNSTGSWNFFMLDTKKVVAADQWTLVPMTQATIKRMNEIAESESRLLSREPKFWYKGVEIKLTEEDDIHRNLREKPGKVSESTPSLPRTGALEPARRLHLWCAYPRRFLCDERRRITRRSSTLTAPGRESPRA
jgi:hypothetical protein